MGNFNLIFWKVTFKTYTFQESLLKLQFLTSQRWAAKNARKWKTMRYINTYFFWNSNMQKCKSMSIMHIKITFFQTINSSQFYSVFAFIIKSWNSTNTKPLRLFSNDGCFWCYFFDLIEGKLFSSVINYLAKQWGWILWYLIMWQVREIISKLSTDRRKTCIRHDELSQF